MDKKILRDISYGLYIVTANNNQNVGCVINTLNQLTSEDPLISICLNKNNYTNKVISETKKFITAIVSENMDNDIISKFGFYSSSQIDKFANLDYDLINNIPVLKNGICGYIECEVINKIDVGTHDLFIAKITNMKKTSEQVPMTYKYYHEVIKGKSPKNAPTYEEENVSNAYVCDICGYIHEGDLPEDFVCPLCGADKSHFQKK